MRNNTSPNRGNQEGGYEPGKDMLIALDCAASGTTMKKGKYLIDGTEKTGRLIEYYLIDKKYWPIIISIEDPFEQEDWDTYVNSRKVGGKVQIVEMTLRHKR